jgi:hypothetical protein
MRQTAGVAKHDGVRRHAVRGRVEAHFARMLAFDFEPGVKEWRRACTAQGRSGRALIRLSESWNPHRH